MIKYNLGNEAEAWKEIQELRKEFNPRLLDDIKVNSREEAVERATDVVQKTLIDFDDYGFDFSKISPGHGPGHLVRDYINSVILFRNLEANPKHTFVGFIGGSLHDIGCTVIPRYEESIRAIRHAEAGALFVRHLLESQNGLSDLERTAIAYSIAAHTHYRKDEEVKCADGETRVVKPYMELDEKGNPVWPVWFTRWVDRLDCNGPTFVGRHYLTLGEKHQDYDGKAHFDVEFAHHMKPLLRPFKEQVDEKGKINQTMSEHMKMFADSQTNESPYGKHDYGFMVKLRDISRRRLDHIVKLTQYPPHISENMINAVYKSWNLFLSNNIEPSELGAKTARVLDSMFNSLDEETKNAWSAGFSTTMAEYDRWADERLESITQQYPGVYSLKPITDDVRKIIRPNYLFIR